MDTPPVPSTNSQVPMPSSEVSIFSGVLAGALVIVLLAGIVFAAYRLGYLNVPSTGLTATTTPVATIPSNVMWESALGTIPAVRTFSVTQSYSGDGPAYTYTFAAYALGKFTKEPYASSTFYVAAYNDPQSPNQLNAYAYYLGDASGAPQAWWGVDGAYVGYDIPLPTEITSSTVIATTTIPVPVVIQYSNNGRSSDSTGAQVTKSAILQYPDPSAVYSELPGNTIDGGQIIKTPAKQKTFDLSTLQSNSYYARTSFGALQLLSLNPNFVTFHYGETNYAPPVANINWQVGSTTVATYNFSNYLYGVSECFLSFKDLKSLTASFIQTGHTTNGDPLYEVNPQGHDDVYRCLYPKTQRYDYNPTTQVSTSHYPTSYEEFLTTHPIFFWKHQYGEWMAFGRDDVVPAAEKGKPVIYLYPQKTEDVSVKVAPVGGFTKTDPAYGTGWNVLATPESVLTNKADGKTYPYLFWEGGARGIVATPKEGFVAARADIPKLLDNKLALLGLNSKERADFKEFWVPKLSKAPYYFITFVPKSEMDRVAPMTVTPTPDSVIRVLMDYRPLLTLESVTPLEIETPKRTGFTVVEWGGILRD